MQSGIYLICNIKNQRKYVGSAKNIEKRLERHFKNLESGTHHNIFLQRDFNKCGKEYFVTEILELCEYKKNLIEVLEQIYIDNLTPDEKYNLSPATFGDVLTDHPNREEIINKISNTLLSQNKKLTDEERKLKFSKVEQKNGMYGRTHTDEVKKTISRKNKGRTPPNKGKNNIELFGEEKAEEISKQLSEYAKQRTGDKNPFYGKSHSKEFKKILSNKAKERKGKTYKLYQISFPDGQSIIVKGVYKIKELLSVSMPVIYKNMNKGYVKDKKSKIYGYRIEKL